MTRTAYLFHHLEGLDPKAFGLWVAWLRCHGIDWPAAPMDTLLECDDRARNIRVERAPVDESGSARWRHELMEVFTVQLEAPALPFPEVTRPGGTL